MKIIKINTFNPYRDSGKPFDGSTISVSLPSNVVAFERSFGDSTFVGHTFKMADGTYGAVYANLLFESQLVFNSDLKQLYDQTDGSGFTPQLRAYFDLLVGDKEVPQALYHSSREKTLGNLIDFINNDDSTFEYYLSQPFQDTATVKSLTEYWQNNVNSNLSETFGKGNQLPYFSKFENELSIYRIAEQGEYIKADNKFAGNYNTVFYCGGVVNKSYVTETEAIEAATTEAASCQQQQCQRFKSMNYSQEKAEAYMEELKKAKEEAQTIAQAADEAVDQAKTQVSESKANLETAKTEYDECAAEVPPCPDLAALLLKLKEAEAAFASADASLRDAENALNAANQNLEAADKALAQAENNKEIADNQCDEE